MESIPEIDSLDLKDYTSDEDSDYLIQRAERDKIKKEQLMAQRLRGRFAKTQRLRKESDTNYGSIQSSSSDEEDDLSAYWKQIKDKNPKDVRAISSKLFIKTTEKGGRIRTRKLRRKLKTRKIRKNGKIRKSKKVRK